jgi:hypothetical protein
MLSAPQILDKSKNPPDKTEERKVGNITKIRIAPSSLPTPILCLPSLLFGSHESSTLLYLMILISIPFLLHSTNL